METKTEEIIQFRFENVMVSPHGDSKENGIFGYIAVVDESDQTYLCWRKYSNGRRRPKTEQGQTIVTPSFLSDTFLDIATGEIVNSEIEGEDKKKESEDNSYNLKIPIKKVYCIRKHIPTLAMPYIIIKTKQGIAHTPLFFADGGIKYFFQSLQNFVETNKSPTDPNMIFLNNDADLLTRSRRILQSQESLHDENEESYLTMATKATESIMNNLFSTFSLVPKLGRDVLTTALVDHSSSPPQCVAPNPNSVHYGIGSFVIIDGDKLVLSPNLPEVVREQMYSGQEWSEAFNKEGKIIDPNAIKKRIFYGGVHPTLRREVWKYLLGYFPWDSTQEQREIIKETRSKEYFILKSQWKNITKEQESHFSQFRNRRTKIEKDVIRTERTDSHFKDINSPYLRSLHELLLTYCFFNWDIGYAQGMNELLAPILIIMDNEVDTFWCYKGLMDMMSSNFHKDQIGMHSQLVKLGKLIAYIDPPFHNYLKSIDSLNMFFCYRWLLILFRREFSLEQSEILWEVFWTNYYHENFPLFFALAILIKERNSILQSKLTFDGLLKHIIQLSEKMNLVELLNLATSLYLNFERTTDEEVKATIFG